MVKDICSTCGQENPPAKRRCKKAKRSAIGWVCCDGCCKWFHGVCVRIGNELLAEAGNFWFFCEECAVKGSLIWKQATNTATVNTVSLSKTEEQIAELSNRINQLQIELDSLKVLHKRNIDRLQCKLNEVIQLDEKYTSHKKALIQIDEKIEAIQSGSKMAQICTQSVNGFRISINKVPFRQGENVWNLVRNFLDFLEATDAMQQVTKCFRLDGGKSKWSDRTLTPAIIVVFSSVNAKEDVLRRYFEKHKTAKLSSLKAGFSLEYRFTVNEVLSIQTFRIRNLALRMKIKRQLSSVYVKNDRVSVKLPGQMRYTPIKDTHHLLSLVGPEPAGNESSVFFDAESSGFASSQQ